VSAAVALVGKTAAFSGRLVAEYDWISDHQGRNVSGLPTDLRNNAFTLRAEVASECAPSRSASSLVDCSPLAAQALTRVPVSKRSSESRAHNIFPGPLTSLLTIPLQRFHPHQPPTSTFSQGSQTRRYRAASVPIPRPCWSGCRATWGIGSCRCRISTRTPSQLHLFLFGSFSPLTPAGDGGVVELIFRATTRDGKIGPAYAQSMTMDAPQIQGALVISLTWDTEADLDLHVDLPSDGDAGVNEICRASHQVCRSGQSARPSTPDSSPAISTSIPTACA